MNSIFRTTSRQLWFSIQKGVAAWKHAWQEDASERKPDSEISALEQRILLSASPLAIDELWITTRDDVGSSGVSELPSWTDGTVLRIGDPNLNLEPGGTSGTYSKSLELDDFADGNAIIRGLHLVSRDITVGDSDRIELLAGDVLFSTHDNETFHGTDGTSVDGGREDVMVFRPDKVGDYSAGNFFLLFEDIGGNRLQSFTLVETDTTIGDTTVHAGDLLFSTLGSEQNNIQWFQTEDVGDGSTDGDVVTLIEGDDFGLNRPIAGLDLVEEDLTLGGTNLKAGQLVVTVDQFEFVSGTFVTDSDLFVLDITATTHGSGTASADVTMLLRGSDIELADDTEDIRAISFGSSYMKPPPSATNLTQTHSYLEGTGSVPLDDIVVSDVYTDDLITVTLTLADPETGVLSADSGNGETYDSDSGVWTITGVASDVNNALADVAFLPAGENELPTTVEALVRNELGEGPAVGTINLNVISVNDPPAISLVNPENQLAEGTNISTSRKVADIEIEDDSLGDNAWSLAGADASHFEIVGRELRLRGRHDFRF